MSQREYETRILLRDNFDVFARNCLKIRPKSVLAGAESSLIGGLVPFNLNKAQLFAHEKIEEQLKSKNYVRAIILKARQEGLSTYVGGRYLWKALHIKGVRVFILTHEMDATSNLFEMTQRFYANLPDPLKPFVDRNNAKELSFPNLNSGYKVGTAGRGDVGRSQTINFFHGSEVAFWEDADGIASGIMQAIPKQSEIILESTARGIGNYFHQMWVKAVNGESDYIPIFIPWFFMAEYYEKVDESLNLTDEDIAIRTIYGLSNEQMMWRQKKIVEIGISLFKQEYPCNAEEAFAATTLEGLIPEHVVAAARKNICQPHGHLIVGVDPACSENGDNTAIITRQGRVAHSLQVFKTNDTMKIVGILVKMLTAQNISAICIGWTGVGVGIYDRLRELGYGDRVFKIVEGASAYDSNRYKNKKSECWGEMYEWIKDGPVQIPDDDALAIDLCAPLKDENSKGQMFLEEKKKTAKRFGHNFSPDRADALSFTFGIKLGDTNKRIEFSPTFKLSNTNHRQYGY